MTGRAFGIELELNGGCDEVVSALYHRDLIGDNEVHDYHCDCEDCDYWRDGAPFTAQYDSTVDVELISKVLRHRSDEANHALDSLAAVLAGARAIADANSGNGAGNHVHVSVEDFEVDDRLRLLRLFVHYQDQLGALAGGADRRVRDYNRPLEESFAEDAAESVRRGYGFSCHDWLALAKGSDTAEFRLWNSTRVGWRLHLHADVSVAMVDAAKAGVEPDDDLSLVDVLAPFLPVETFAHILTQSLYNTA